MDLFRKIFGRKKTATTAAPAPAPEKKRAAAEAAPAPAPKKPRKDNTNVLRRVNQLRDLRGRQALLFTCPTRQERKAASEAFELLQEYATALFPVLLQCVCVRFHNVAGAALVKSRSTICEHDSR